MPLTMYTTQWCGFCKRLKAQLGRAGVEMNEVDIERDQVAAEFVMSVNGGNQTVPTLLFADGSTMVNPSAAQVQARLAELAEASVAEQGRLRIVLVGPYARDGGDEGGKQVGMSVDGPAGRHGRDDDVVVRKADHGWVVGGENVSDLTSAIVLADLFAADLAADDDTAMLEAVDRNGGSRPERPHASQHAAARQDAPTQRAARRSTPGRHAARPTGNDGAEADEAARLAVTVSQLEHALASRVRVEQAIGVLAERHRLRPREAFDLLRGAARARGQRVTEIAQDVVASTANPLLRLPEELARKLPEQRPRGRPLRRGPKPAEQF